MKNRYTRRLPISDHSEDTSGKPPPRGRGVFRGAGGGDLVRQFCPGPPPRRGDLGHP